MAWFAAGLVSLCGADDLGERHLGAKGNAFGPFEREECFNHEQAEDMLLLRHAGQQYAGRTQARRQGGHCLPQYAFGQFSK